MNARERIVLHSDPEPPQFVHDVMAERAQQWQQSPTRAALMFVLGVCVGLLAALLLSQLPQVSDGDVRTGVPPTPATTVGVR